MLCQLPFSILAALADEGASRDEDGLYRSVQERNALPRHYAAALNPPESFLVQPIIIIIIILQGSFHDGFFRGHFPSFERPRIFLPTHYDANKNPGKA